MLRKFFSLKKGVTGALLFFILIKKTWGDLPDFILQYRFFPNQSLIYTLKMEVNQEVNHFGMSRGSKQEVRFLVSMKPIKIQSNGDATVLFRVLSGNWTVDGKVKNAPFQSEMVFEVNPFGQVKGTEFKDFKKDLFLFQVPPFPLNIRSKWNLKKKITIQELNLPMMFLGKMNIQSYDKSPSGDEVCVILARIFGKSSTRFPVRSSMQGKTNIQFDLKNGRILESAMVLEIKTEVGDKKGIVTSQKFSININAKLNR